jgi:hypothetical protein
MNYYLNKEDLQDLLIDLIDEYDVEIIDNRFREGFVKGKSPEWCIIVKFMKDSKNINLHFKERFITNIFRKKSLEDAVCVLALLPKRILI